MRVCSRCNRPLVIFRGFWQCKHCIEEREKKWNTPEHIKEDIEKALEILEKDEHPKFKYPKWKYDILFKKSEGKKDEKENC